MRFVAVHEGEQIALEVVRKDGKYVVTLEDRCVIVDAIRLSPHSLSLLVDGVSHEAGIEKRNGAYSVYFYDDTLSVELYEARKFKAAEVAKKTTHHGPVKVTAPMPGKILRVLVAEKAHVHEGDPLVVIEAMKMQNELKSPKTGVVIQIHVTEGVAVGGQQILMTIE